MRAGVPTTRAPASPPTPDSPTPPSAAAGPVPPAVQRLRLAAVVLGLWLLTFSQSSGLPSADTKLDLVVAPGRFLRHALSMWDPVAAAGQMQDQAYGYLFPMGPAFLLGKLAALPAWMVQRSWESLLVTAAFLGMVRLARALGVSGFLPPVGAGLAYALAPRVLSELTVISAELIPVAMLPWVLEPLVTGGRTGSPRRAAARSGLAFALVGGVNASAALAILPVPVLWLATRGRGPRRRALAGWTALALLLASLWWIVPLLVLGRYSPPFLDWIESASITTRVTDFVDVLRGTDHWQAFLGPSEWPGGWILVAAPAAIIATSAVAALGLAGIGRKDTPHRGFLVTCLITGVLLVSLGHQSDVGPAFAGTARHLLDAALRSFRNVHKFDPVLRLPLAVGVGHCLAAIGARLPRVAAVRAAAPSGAGRARAVTVQPRLLAAGCLVALAAVAAAPALTGDLVTRTRSVADPVWWHDAGSWLGRHSAQGRALVVPGAAQPTYVWGAPRDDALQPVAAGPWAVRDAAPLGQPGYVRLLDAVEAILAAGRPAPELAPVLARAGIAYLVVRNDLDTQRSGATALRYVHATIASSPGWAQVAAFGAVFDSRTDPNRLVDGGLLSSPDAVQIYRNPVAAGATARAALLPASNALAATGSADTLPGLVAAGVPDDVPVLYGDAAAAVRAAGVPVQTVATDGLRRREFRFGGVDQYSATMTAAQAFVQQRSTHDYLPTDPGPLSTVSYVGIADVHASSSAADPGALYLSAADGPWAALDGDPASAWRSAAYSAVGQWLEVDLDQPTDPGEVQIAFAAGSGPLPSRVAVSTDTGTVVQDVAPAAVLQTLRLPAGPARFVRVTVLGVADRSRGARVAISTLAMAGVHPARTLVVPGSGTPQVMSFDVATGSRPACLSRPDGAPACDDGWAAAGEEDAALDRTVRLASPARYGVAAEVRLVPGSALDSALDRGNPVRAAASSVNSADPRQRPGAAVDGDARTGWVARPGDRSPTLSITVAKPGLIDTIAVLPIAGGAVTAPTRVAVSVGAETVTADLPPDGVVHLPRPVRSGSVRVTVLASTLRVSVDSLTGVAKQLPVGIGEVRLGGRDMPAPRPPSLVSLPCGSAIVTAGADLVPLAVSASVPDVLAGAALPAQACAVAQLAAGPSRLRLARNALVAPVSLTLAQFGASLQPRGAAATQMDILRWGDTSRSVRVATTAPALLVVHENANGGWRASLRGRALAPVTVDGWQQGWLVPAGAAGTVLLSFSPQTTVNAGLVAGAVALLALGLLAAVRGRGRGSAPPAATDGRLPRRLVLGAAVVALGLLGGWWALLLAGVVMTLVERGPLRRVAATTGLGVVSAGLMVVAGLLEAVGPPGSRHALGNSAGTQLVVLAALALLIFGTATPGPAEPAQQRALDDVPGQRGRSGSARGGEDVQGQEVSGEQPPAESTLQGEQ